jgi:hypothetical protein
MMLNRLDMSVWRGFLNIPVTLLQTNGVVGGNSSGLDRSHVLKDYMKRTKMTIQQLRVTLFVDTRLNAIIDLYMTTIRKHELQIAPSIIKRNTGEVASPLLI